MSNSTEFLESLLQCDPAISEEIFSSLDDRYPISMVPFSSSRERTVIDFLQYLSRKLKNHDYTLGEASEHIIKLSENLDVYYLVSINGTKDTKVYSYKLSPNENGVRIDVIKFVKRDEIDISSVVRETIIINKTSENGMVSGAYAASDKPGLSTDEIANAASSSILDIFSKLTREDVKVKRKKFSKHEELYEISTFREYNIPNDIVQFLPGLDDVPLELKKDYECYLGSLSENYINNGKQPFLLDFKNHFSIIFCIIYRAEIYCGYKESQIPTEILEKLKLSHLEIYKPKKPDIQ